MKLKLKTLSKNLKLLRTASNLSQDDLAAEIHISRSTYSTYETGSKIPDLQTIDALSSLYNISFDSLINHDLSEGMMHKIYFEKESQHLAEIMNAYQNLSIASKKIIMERIEVLLERENIFYNEYLSSHKQQAE